MNGTKIDLNIPDFRLFLEYLENVLKLNDSGSYNAGLYFMALNKEIPLEWENHLISFKEKMLQTHNDDFVEFLRIESNL